jgi:hypothetical protein
MPVLEITDYALLPTAQEGDLLAARPMVDAWLRSRPGFLSLLTARDGARWTDIAEWQDMASAHAAAEAFPTEPALVPFLRLLDPAALAMRHLEVVGRA